MKAGILPCYWPLGGLTVHTDLFVPALRVKHFHGLQSSSVRATSPLLHKQSLLCGEQRNPIFIAFCGRHAHAQHFRRSLLGFQLVFVLGDELTDLFLLVEES